MKTVTNTPLQHRSSSCCCSFSVFKPSRPSTCCAELENDAPMPLIYLVRIDPSKKHKTPVNSHTHTHATEEQLRHAPTSGASDQEIGNLRRALTLLRGSERRDPRGFEMLLAADRMNLALQMFGHTLDGRADGGPRGSNDAHAPRPGLSPEEIAVCGTLRSANRMGNALCCSNTVRIRCWRGEAKLRHLSRTDRGRGAN